jgi:hypothetical protein
MAMLVMAIMERTPLRGVRKAAKSIRAAVAAIALVWFALPASAAELAILRNGFNLRHDHHLVMGETTRLFFTADDSSFTDVPTSEITGFEKDLALPVPPPADARSTPLSSPPPSANLISPLPLDEVVNSASAAYHLDPDLVNSVIHAESGFNSHAVSPKGAQGLMQLMPGTANQLGVVNAFDPQANVTGGSRYLRELLERYNFDLVKALAAYNAGPERVEQYGGVPPFHETRAYVARVVHEYNTKKIAQEKLARQQQRVAAGASAKNANATKKTGGVKKASSKDAGRAQAPLKPGMTVIAAQSAQAASR